MEALKTVTPAGRKIVKQFPTSQEKRSGKILCIVAGNNGPRSRWIIRECREHKYCDWQVIGTLFEQIVQGDDTIREIECMWVDRDRLAKFEDSRLRWDRPDAKNCREWWEFWGIGANHES
jgi:hypothetical protein